MKNLTCNNIEDVVNYILNDLENKVNTNSYGDSMSDYYSLIYDGEEDLNVSVTEEKEGLDECDYYYSIHIIDDITGANCDLDSAAFSREALTEKLKEIQQIHLSEFQKSAQ